MKPMDEAEADKEEKSRASALVGGGENHPSRALLALAFSYTHTLSPFAYVLASFNQHRAPHVDSVEAARRSGAVHASLATSAPTDSDNGPHTPPHTKNNHTRRQQEGHREAQPQPTQLHQVTMSYYGPAGGGDYGGGGG